MFEEREATLKKLSQPLDCVCFRTSIWDETLYKASLIPWLNPLTLSMFYKRQPIRDTLPN